MTVINKIKAQMYQALRENATYVVFIVMALVYVVMDLINAMDESSSQMSGSFMFVTSAPGVPFVLNMLTLIYTARTCGGDIIDRTMNYELLDGAKRSEVYFSRFLVSLFWSLVTCILLIVLPVAAVGAVSGWGYMLTLSEAVKRVALLIFPIVRMTALYTLLTFAVMDFRAVIAAGFLLGQAEMIAYMLIDESNSLGINKRVFDLFSISAVTRLLDVTNIGFGYVGGEDVQVVKNTMTASDNGFCAGVCLALTAVYLLAGYLIFRRRDIK